MVRMWLICGFWEVDEVVPITYFIIKPLGVTSTFAFMHAKLVDVDWVSEIHDRCEMDILNGLSKVAT